jgi:hypothetical protein
VNAELSLALRREEAFAERQRAYIDCLLARLRAAAPGLGLADAVGSPPRRGAKGRNVSIELSPPRNNNNRSGLERSRADDPDKAQLLDYLREALTDLDTARTKSLNLEAELRELRQADERGGVQLKGGWGDS